MPPTPITRAPFLRRQRAPTAPTLQTRLPRRDSPVRRPRPPLSSNPPLPHVVSTRPPRSRSLPIRALNQSAGEKPAADRNAILQAILRLPPNDPRTLQLSDALEPMWATTTWANRERMWLRMQQYCAAKGVPSNSTNAVLFLHSLPLASSTRMGYAGGLRTLFQLMGEESTPLKLYIKALQAQGGLEPTRQMQPVNPILLQKLRRHLNPKESMCCLLCWKAAARWTETADLRREQFVSVTSCEVIIYWGRGTKTTRLNPFRPHLYAIVTGPGTPELAQHIQSMNPGQRLCYTTVREMGHQIRSILGQGYGTHSIKRGAITHLFHEISLGNLRMQEVQNLTKHQNIESLLRYNANSVTTARALGTQRVSALLPVL